MKSGREHRVPLPGRAVAILQGAGAPRAISCSAVASPAGRSGIAALLELLRGMRPGVTVHGFRSVVPRLVRRENELCARCYGGGAGHAIGDEVVKAYRRGDLFDKRRKLMEAWAAFLAKPLPAEGAKVVRLRG